MRSICIFKDTLYYSNSYISSLIEYLQFQFGNQIQIDQGQIFDYYTGFCRVIGNKAIENNLSKIKDILKTPIKFTKYSDTCKNTNVTNIKYIHIQKEIYEDINLKIVKL